VEADEDAAAAAEVPTVAQRMKAAGIAAERVREHLAAGRVRVDDVAQCRCAAASVTEPARDGADVDAGRDQLRR
jgi:hypothetical protein